MENEDLYEVKDNTEIDNDNLPETTKKIIFTPSSENDKKEIHFTPSFKEISTTKDVLIKRKYTTE